MYLFLKVENQINKEHTSAIYFFNATEASERLVSE